MHEAKTLKNDGPAQDGQRRLWTAPVVTTLDAGSAEGGDTINSDGTFTS